MTDHPEPQLQVRRLLVTEDDDVAWKLYGQMFPTDRYEIAAKHDTMPDWSDVDLSDIDAILMDGSVSRADDGYQAVRDIRQMGHTMPIIVASYAPDFAEAERSGANSAWVKSAFDSDGLFRRLDGAFDV